MSQQDKSSRIAVLLFTDIVDSVGLQSRLGSDAYFRLLKLHDQLFRQVLQLVPQSEIRNETGDGFLSEFNTAADAVNAALLFQMLLRQTRWETEPPKVRIGIHQGHLAEILVDTISPGKIVGMTVNIASRVMSLAEGGQILMTRPVYDDARHFVREHPVVRPDDASPPAVKWKDHGRYLFQGTDDPIRVFEVGATGFAPFISPSDSAKVRSIARSPKQTKWQPLIGPALTVLCGLLLWGTPLGDAWENTSYDLLFRFGNRAVTNKIVLVHMDDDAYHELRQTRGEWNRALHTELLNKLHDGGSPLVVFDVSFKARRDTDTDAALAKAMQRHGRVALMAWPVEPENPKLETFKAILPDELFLQAATNWGVGKAGAAKLETARRHWPFPAPADQYPSLPWTAARLAGAKLNDTPQEQWLRYYGRNGGWEAFSFHFALSNAPSDFFRDKIVFIGNQPGTDAAKSSHEDTFRTPYGEEVAGMDILATEFLNLVNNDWLRRPAAWAEALLLTLTGILLGGGLYQLRPMMAGVVAAAIALAVMLAFVSLSYFTNYWFPWLVIAGGQVPCALAWAVVAQQVRQRSAADIKHTQVITTSDLLVTPGYERFEPPIGSGAFGKVWLVRTVTGEWKALKVLYRTECEKQKVPYEVEFEGIKRYKPISNEFPGLLHLEHVGRNEGAGYFYYVMELGDAIASDWGENPAKYQPRDLENERARTGGRFPAVDCVRIVLPLTKALDFLHRQGLTHRDIKPRNIIFVKGQPKLADIGLVSNIRPPDQEHTRVGTPGYMPPAPEPPGTAQADIYGLGMVLYVIYTGRDPAVFPEVSTTLVERTDQMDFIRLNAIILKACHPDRKQRYASAAEMHAALVEVQAEIEPHSAKQQ